jgi:hypothetical protein
MLHVVAMMDAAAATRPKFLVFVVLIKFLSSEILDKMSKKLCTQRTHYSTAEDAEERRGFKALNQGFFLCVLCVLCG